MKKLLTIIMAFLFAGSYYAQSVTLDDFDSEPADSNYWNFVMNENADTAVSFLHLDYTTSEVHDGAGALKLDYSVHNAESWGGFVKMEHWNPDTNAYFDFSAYQNISVWYYNATPQDSAGRVHLRIQFYDASDSPNGANTYTSDDTELYYSFHYILDNTPGWNQIIMPMVRNDSWDGGGFNLTGWAGIPGNGELNLDKIKGWGFEFSVSGGGDGDHVAGSVILDTYLVQDIAPNPILFFNGKQTMAGMSQFAWGDSQLNLVEGGGMDPATNALQWIQGDQWANGWSGAGWNIDTPIDLGFRWDLDSMRFKMKATSGTQTIRMQLESGADGAVGFDVDPIDDNAWHDYVLPLKNFTVLDAAKPNFDSTNITTFQFMAEGNSVIGNELWFDYIWTGNPVIDVVAPNPPDGVTGAAGNFINIVTWFDVPDENGEAYNVYYSKSPITDVNADGVGLVAANVGEGVQSATHVLLAPAEDQSVTYYYAVTCQDAFANVSDPGVASASVTNTARGVNVIYPQSPSSFAVDGNLEEWTVISPFRMFPSDGSGSIVTNTSIDDDADLSVNGYVAMDANNLYVAFDIEDDVVSHDTTFASYLIDAPDLFIGLYDGSKISHVNYERGAEPDYHFRFGFNALTVDNLGGAVIARNGDGTYIYKDKFPSGYTVEAVIPFATLAATGGDDLFVPVNGMQLPIDYSINDNDTPNSDAREGILTYSPANEDKSWADVSRWFVTWIGNLTSVEDEEVLPVEFALDQNYPNPFNPSTLIRYSLKEDSFVSLKIYNVVGQEVASMVNRNQKAGRYELSFNASNLASGVYIYQISAGSFISSKKMMLLK